MKVIGEVVADLKTKFKDALENECQKGADEVRRLE